MRRVVKVSVTAKPISPKRVLVRTSVSKCGVTRTKTQSIRVK